MRTSNTEHDRDLKLKWNSLCMFQKKFVLPKLTVISNTEQHIFIFFPSLLFKVRSWGRRMERNSSLTAVHTLSCMLCTQSFTVKWLGTELVQNFLTKLTFFIQENAVTWKVSRVQMSLLVSDLPSHPNLMKAKWLGNSPGVGVEIQVPSPAVSQQWGHLTSKCLPFQVLLLELLYPVLVTGNVPQKGKEEVSWSLSLGLRKAPNTTRHISQANILTMESSTVLRSLHPTQLKEFDTKGQHIQSCEVET